MCRYTLVSDCISFLTVPFEWWSVHELCSANHLRLKIVSLRVRCAFLDFSREHPWAHTCRNSTLVLSSRRAYLNFRLSACVDRYRWKCHSALRRKRRACKSSLSRQTMAVLSRWASKMLNAPYNERHSSMPVGIVRT